MPLRPWIPVWPVLVTAAIVAAVQQAFPIPVAPQWVTLGGFGVALAAGMVWRTAGIAPAVLGTFLVAVLVVPVVQAILAATVVGLSTCVVVMAVRNSLSIAPGLDRPADVLRFAGVAAVVAVVRGVLTSLFTALSGEPFVLAGMAAAAFEWLATLVFVPAVVIWSRTRPDPLTSRWQMAEIAILIGLTTGLAWGWLGVRRVEPLAVPVTLLAWLLGLGNWIAYRLHVRGMAALISVVGITAFIGGLTHGSLDPLIVMPEAAAQRIAWLVSLGGIAFFHLIIAAVARDFYLRDLERAALTDGMKLQAERINEVNSRLTIQSLEIADQAAELELQRDESQKLAAAAADEHRWLETVVAQLPVGVLLTDPTGRVLCRNRRFEEQLGLTLNTATPNVEAFRGWDVRTPTDEPIPFDHWPLVRAITTGESVHGVDMRIQRFGDSDWIDANASAVTIRGGDGRSLGAVLVVQDTTDIRAAERQMRRNEDRLRLLESVVVNAHDAVIVLEAEPQTDRGRAVLYVNAAFTAITGYRASEVVGRSLHFLRGPKTDPNTLNDLRMALDGFTPYRCELLNYHKDGREVWVSLSLVPVAGPDGRHQHFVMIQRDITYQRQTEEAVRASEARFRGIFETASAGVSITGADGTFSDCNPAFAAMLGRPVEEILGRSPAEFTHPDDIPVQQEFIRQVQSGAIRSYQFRKRYVRPNGTHTWTELSFNALYDARGMYTAGLGVSVDVTSRLQLEDQLRQAQKMEALGQLAGGVAHDFNNLLTAIIGNLERIPVPADHPARPHLRTIETAATRAADLTRKLLGYARRNQLMTSPRQPAMLLDEVADILRRTVDPRIEIHTRTMTTQSVSVDQTLITQALLNLCLNARDSMPDGGRLTLTAERVRVAPDEALSAPDARPGEFIRLAVEDTGTGISDEVQQHIFEPFFTTKGVGRGTGLGLPMVHGILRQHSGWVAFHSREGVGSRFELYLPLADQADNQTVVPRLPTTTFEPVTPMPLSSPPPITEPTTILLVDDESMIRTLGRAILESHGYTVLEAEDGQAAVELYTAEKDRIDLVILDVTMPRMSGRDACRHIIHTNPTARVLFSSGYSADDLSDVDGSRGLLSKPYRPADLLTAVHTALGRDSATAL